MKIGHSAFGGIVLLTLLVIHSTASLECYKCFNSFNLNECNSTVICAKEQVCYKRRKFTDQVQFDLSCIEKKECGRYATIQNGSEVAKMSADKTSYCFECCSKDRCNYDLCDYPPHSLCKDDESVDCAKWNSMFSICEVTSEAKKVCPKFCNLCNLVDGNWSPWSLWSPCDVTCGKGSLIRHRTCSNPAPQKGGLDCPGKRTDSKGCTLQPCPVHGGWSLWDNWSKCSASCGIGMRRRNRTCTNPRPQRFGDHCFGDSTDDKLCNFESCAVNGGWSEWSAWGNCSISCDVGLQSRSRSCTNPTPVYTGRQCIGQNVDVKLCHRTLCPGEWTAWQSWSNCSGICGKSVQTRKRTCQNVLYTKDCLGNASETRSCYLAECYTDCKDIMQHSGRQSNGIFNVRLWKSKSIIPVYCDFDTDKGGWTVFQRRFNGSIDFYRNFTEYENGFGYLNGEFWLGLRYIYEMVTQGKTELRIDLSAADGTAVYETFQNFRLEKNPHYTLRIDKGVGTAGDGLSYHNSYKFSTYDVDQDNAVTNCAVQDHGGWWYARCAYINLNGEYVTPGTTHPSRGERGMNYYPFRKRESLLTSKMMFRRV